MVLLEVSRLPSMADPVGCYTCCCAESHVLLAGVLGLPSDGVLERNAACGSVETQKGQCPWFKPL